jgi:5-methylcytosine-specific restriction endonuclease McrA
VSETYIPAAVRRLVAQRANHRCEYCMISSENTLFPHEIDHTIPEKHGGKTSADNLALTCWRCNRHKGSDVGSFDLLTGEFTFLFHPRLQKWSDHFTWNVFEIQGKTPEGRVTVQLLQLNSIKRLIERQE